MPLQGYPSGADLEGAESEDYSEPELVDALDDDDIMQNSANSALPSAAKSDGQRLSSPCAFADAEPLAWKRVQNHDGMRRTLIDTLKAGLKLLLDLSVR